MEEKKAELRNNVMNVSDVKMGEKYKARVSGKPVTVQVIGEHSLDNGRRGFDATNLDTGRRVLLKGAGRLHPFPVLIQFFIDVDGETKEITRKEAIDIVIQCFGPREVAGMLASRPDRRRLDDSWHWPFKHKDIIMKNNTTVLAVRTWRRRSTPKRHQASHQCRRRTKTLSSQ